MEERTSFSYFTYYSAQLMFATLGVVILCFYFWCIVGTPIESLVLERPLTSIFIFPVFCVMAIFTKPMCIFIKEIKKSVSMFLLVHICLNAVILLTGSLLADVSYSMSWDVQLSATVYILVAIAITAAEDYIINEKFEGKIKL